ncbi:MAG TPA: flagellar hook-associated protein FlgL [Plasticicumulans sp.]|uniref:flagellar hook-associated protein FlgL n=1 Tax=Plasticicumulans sp. TaxID=2307179 RepID=UPI002C8265BB|nr:flagellar hook-associated protein FlgL [Plasticicumulans sp.]HMV39190.1 flagellar hook-associated protein FlgL [Plasticicumulans sp.]HNG49798.1 flagellar hook-associated protein FlgL [Plasticicumulans sp.]
MIRISTSYTQEQGVQYMRDAQKRVVDTQAELATGKRISSPSDDPVGAARLIDLHHQIDSTARFQTNIAMATGRLATSDSILDEAGQLTQRARELVVQANNAPLADSDRVSIAQELRQIRGQLLEHANSKDGNGDYLYAGYKTQTTPFIETTGGQVVYQGDSGQRLLGIAPTRSVAVSDAGDSVFMNIRAGNGVFATTADAGNSGSAVIEPGDLLDPTAFEHHRFQIDFQSSTDFTITDLSEVPPTGPGPVQTLPADGRIEFNGISVKLTGAPANGDRFEVAPAPYQDAFTTLDKVITALETPVAATGAARTKFAQTMADAMQNLDQMHSNFLDTRTQIGARLNGLETQESANSEFSLRMQSIANDIEGLDYAEASSRLAAYTLTLQAAQQSYVKIQNLNLFNYL